MILAYPTDLHYNRLKKLFYIMFEFGFLVHTYGRGKK